MLTDCLNKYTDLAGVTHVWAYNVWSNLPFDETRMVTIHLGSGSLSNTDASASSKTISTFFRALCR